MSTQSQSNHTPLPWRIGDAGLTVFGPKRDAPSPETVAHTSRANAAYIVRCVNSHDALVSALVQAENWMREYATCGPDEQEGQGLIGLLADVRTALEQAGGAQ